MRAMHVIRVRKGTIVALLVFTTLVMVAMLYLLSGRAYAAETHPYREIVARILGSSGRGPVSRDALLAILMPVIANILLFMPWGFLAFLALDSPKRARTSTYALTVLAAVLFAAAMYVWQQFLPTRVTSPVDTIANAAGALAGAALGHARKSVRMRFEG